MPELEHFSPTPVLSERDLVGAAPDYGSKGCLCGPHATPADDCPVHWALALLERKTAPPGFEWAGGDDV